MFKSINKTKQNFIPLLKILIALLCLGYILSQIFHHTESFSVLYDLVLQHSLFAQLSVLLVCILLSLCNWFLEFFKWKILASEIQPIRFKTAARQTLIAHSIAILTPNKIGDYGAKMLFFSKQHCKRIIGLNFWNNFSQMAITLFFGSIGLVFISHQFIFETLLQLNYQLLVVLLFCFVLLYFLFKKKLSKIWFSYETYFTINNTLKIQLLLLSLLRYLFFAHQYIFLGWFFGWDLSYTSAFPILCVVYLFASIIPSIFILDASVKASLAIFLFAFVHVASPIILCISALMWLLNFLLPSLLGSLLLWPSRRRNTSLISKIKVN